MPNYLSYVEYLHGIAQNCMLLDCVRPRPTMLSPACCRNDGLPMWAQSRTLNHDTRFFALSIAQQPLGPFQTRRILILPAPALIHLSERRLIPYMLLKLEHFSPYTSCRQIRLIHMAYSVPFRTFRRLIRAQSVCRPHSVVVQLLHILDQQRFVDEQ